MYNDNCPPNCPICLEEELNVYPEDIIDDEIDDDIDIDKVEEE